MSEAGPGSAKRIEVSDASRDLDTLPDPDYAVSFAVPVGPSYAGSAEDWARACFERAPRPVRWYLLGGWRLGLGLRLGSTPPAAYVLGWRIVSSSPEVVILEARSRLLAAHNLVEVRDGRVVLTTFVRYDLSVARPLWSLAAPLHRLTVPWLMDRAVPPTAS